LWPSSRYYPKICLEALRKTIKTLKVTYVTAEAVSGHSPNKSQKPAYSLAEKKHCT